MKVLVLTPSLPDTSPSMRFRLEQWAPYLERNGFAFHFQAFEDRALHEVMYQPGRLPAKAYQMCRAMWRRLRMPALAEEHDLVFLHREAAGLGPALVERLLARRGVPLVYDFDDPELLKHPLAYLSEPGYWYPSNSEVVGLRQYLQKGGFLIADDFHFPNEWAVFEDVRLPDGKYLIPGVIDSTTNYIEHPELVAQRIATYARLVGPERVVAGTDCGFGTAVSRDWQVVPSIVWAKLRSLVEGARLASGTI